MIKVYGLEDINKTLGNIDKNLSKNLISEVTHDAYDNVKKRAKPHHVTGNMEDNISLSVNKKSLHGEVFIEDHGMIVDVKGRPTNYALFVLFGTKKHPIASKNKKSLRFSSVNQFVFTKGVNHPGYKGDNFLEKGVKDTFKKLDTIFQRVTNGY